MMYGSNDPVTGIAIIIHKTTIRSILLCIVMSIHHSKVAGYSIVE